MDFWKLLAQGFAGAASGGYGAAGKDYAISQSEDFKNHVYGYNPVNEEMNQYMSEQAAQEQSNYWNDVHNRANAAEQQNKGTYVAPQVANGAAVVDAQSHEYGSADAAADGLYDKMTDGVDTAIQLAQMNNAFNASQAENQMRFQRQSAERAMQFSAAEAAKNRDWQELMSNTAHQREVADLKAAGLNPVLSATGGNGAAVGSGASADGVSASGAKATADSSAVTAALNAATAIAQMETNLRITSMNNATTLAARSTGGKSADELDWKTKLDYETAAKIAINQANAEATMPKTIISTVGSLFGSLARAFAIGIR